MRGQARANGLLVGVAAPPVVLVVAVGTDDDTPGIQVDKAARRIDAAGQLRRPIHHTSVDSFSVFWQARKRALMIPAAEETCWNLMTPAGVTTVVERQRS